MNELKQQSLRFGHWINSRLIVLWAIIQGRFFVAQIRFLSLSIGNSHDH